MVLWISTSKRVLCVCWSKSFVGAITGVSINAGRPPFYACFSVLFLIFPFFFLLVTEKDKKMKNLVFTLKQMISTRERHAEHPFDGRNPQQCGMKIKNKIVRHNLLGALKITSLKAAKCWKCEHDSIKVNEVKF